MRLRTDLLPKDKTLLDKYFKEEVLDSIDFKEHIKETARLLNIHEQIVYDVVVFYFKKIYKLIHIPVVKTNTKINVYGYFTLTVLKHNRTKKHLIK